MYLKLYLAREFIYYHIRNVTGGRVCGVRADLRSLVLVSCDCACSNVSDKKYNRNSSGQLTQTCPALAIKTATVIEVE